MWLGILVGGGLSLYWFTRIDLEVKSALEKPLSGEEFDVTAGINAVSRTVNKAFNGAWVGLGISFCGLVISWHAARRMSPREPDERDNNQR